MRRLMAVIILACLAIAQAQANNDTSTSDGDDAQCPINVPGFFHRGDCNLLCKPASWTDVLVFFLGNYVAHAATVITSPGQTTLQTVTLTLSAVLFPNAGIRNGLRAIINRSQLESFSSLQKAARAGALLTVVKQDQEGGGCRKPNRSIHGSYNIPPGYKLQQVKWDATFQKFDEETPSPSLTDRQNDSSNTGRNDPLPKEICCSYNFFQIAASLVQLVFAVMTLYRTRGNQIERYGYAAFGLTVVPYAWMSVINLLGNLLSPQYDTAFIVGSATLNGLRDRNEPRDRDVKWSVVECTVGILSETNDSTDQHAGNWITRFAQLIQRRFYSLRGSLRLLRGLLRLFWYPFLLFFKLQRLFADVEHYRGAITNDFEDDLMYMWTISLVPIAVVGGLSRFQPGDSATYQRVWTMLWLVSGQTVGTNTAAIFDLPPKDPREPRQPELPEELKQPVELKEPRELKELGQTGGPKKHNETDSSSDSSSFSMGKFQAIYGRLIWAAVPIGGLVVVGQMVREFGTCEEL
ncbi:nacht domain protein [Colletotrichum musicola]|uniref:Nacht domain protein n=1 Tax=Colletotrichum musicola TaxID=2175873 RepID=A0A8H6JU43_9PEZI|nr:nacht domain protein [Colletotrichum musicola]